MPPTPRRGSLRVHERAGVVELGQRRIGRLQACAEHSALVGATQSLRPIGVGLVFEHLAAHERQRLLERAPSEAGRLVGGALEQLVEAVEVEVDEIGGEAIRLRLGDHELARPLAVRRKAAPQHRHERLKRAGGVLRQVLSPEQVGEAIGADAVSARGQQQLQHLLGAGAAEVARPERAAAGLDLEWPEEPDEHVFFLHKTD